MLFLVTERRPAPTPGALHPATALALAIGAVVVTIAAVAATLGR